MELHRDLYAEGHSRMPPALLQSLLVAELLSPSSRIWISSPWISDVDLIDNSARQFGQLAPSWPASWIRFSDVLATFLERGTDIVVISNHDPHNTEFLSRMDLLGDIYPGRVSIIRIDEVHEKGILSDHFTIDGSMNFTYNGIYINQEYLAYRCGSEIVYERRIVLENRWADSL